MQVRFTKSARRHRIGRARALYVLEHPYAVLAIRRVDLPAMLMHVGDDMTGRALEVGVVDEDDQLVVIQVMDLRDKFRNAYEAGRRSR